VSRKNQNLVAPQPLPVGDVRREACDEAKDAAKTDTLQTFKYAYESKSIQHHEPNHP
jgi:hypothetical protein